MQSCTSQYVGMDGRGLLHRSTVIPAEARRFLLKDHISCSVLGYAQQKSPVVVPLLFEAVVEAASAFE